VSKRRLRKGATGRQCQIFRYGTASFPALLLGSLGAVLDCRGRRVALSNLRVAFGDEISAKARSRSCVKSYDCHLLHGGVSQKRAFDFGGRNIFTDTYDDVFRVVAN
jgi:hypothetical protein